MVVSINYQGGSLRIVRIATRQNYKVSESCQALGRLLRHGGDYGALCLGKGGKDGGGWKGLRCNKHDFLRLMMASCH